VKNLPPFGKALATRLRFNNPPALVRLCIGLDAWSRAKKWRKSESDFHALVYDPDKPPGEYSWPVRGCVVVLEWGVGPSRDLVLNLVDLLRRGGAERVIVLPLFEDLYSKQGWHDATKPPGQRFTQSREVIRVYRKICVKNDSHRKISAGG